MTVFLGRSSACPARARNRLFQQPFARTPLLREMGYVLASPATIPSIHSEPHSILGGRIRDSAFFNDFISGHFSRQFIGDE